MSSSGIFSRLTVPAAKAIQQLYFSLSEVHAVLVMIQVIIGPDKSW